MQGRIVEVNYQRGLAIFEDAIGDYGYFEMLSSDKFVLSIKTVSKRNMGWIMC